MTEKKNITNDSHCCGTCYFFEKKDDNGGLCRVNPAQMLTVPVVQQGFDPVSGQIKGQQALQVKGHFPLMAIEDYGCGNHSERLKELTK